MIITKQWIHAHKTDGGAWNKPQLKAIGIDWPATKGWINDVIGKDIPLHSQVIFESHAGSKPAPSKIDELEMKLAEVLRRLTLLESLADID